MTTEEAQKVLNELDNVRPELLNDDAKRLFEAIMKIADTRDEALIENRKLKTMVDLMAEKLAEYEFEEMCEKIGHYCIGCPREDDLDGYMECIKHYFENIAKEDK